MREKSNKVYIYDMKKINFYLANNVQPIEMGWNPTSRTCYLVFDYEDSKEVYEKWVSQGDRLRAEKKLESRF